MAGTCTELTRYGDKVEIRRDIDRDVLYEAAKFRRIEQYDSIMLQRKNFFAQRLLTFSIIRNSIQMNVPSRTLRESVADEAKDENVAEHQRIAKYLKVFNGMKGSSMLLAAWGLTFYFSWFGVVQNKGETDQMRKTLLFNIVTGTIYTVPTFFFCSGFLQTYSFLHNDKKESMFKFDRLSAWYLRKLFRYVPINIVALLAVVYIMPYIGAGPIWKNFQTLTAPCT